MQISLKLLHMIARNRPVKQITFEGSPYIERFFLLERAGWTYYLHRMLGPDPDRDLHNHPWQYAFSRVLYGSYIERRLEFGFQRRKIENIPSSVINIIRGYYYYNNIATKNMLSEYTWHTIVQIKEPETWTLFWHSPWFRSWGFLTEKGYSANKPFDQVANNKWWQEKNCPKGKDVMYELYGSGRSS